MRKSGIPGYSGRSAVLMAAVVLAGTFANAAGNQGGWQWENPLPTGNDLAAVWGSGPADVFAVGASGTIVHYNGTSWSGMASGTTDYLTSVWGSGPADVFAVSTQGTILHYNGTSWSGMTSGTTEWLSGIWGTGPNDVFAVSTSGSILKTASEGSPSEAGDPSYHSSLSSTGGYTL